MASRNGRGCPLISVVVGAVLLSSIAIDSLPSDLPGHEIFNVSWDLTLTARIRMTRNHHEKYMMISGYPYQRCCSDQTWRNGFDSCMPALLPMHKQWLLLHQSISISEFRGTQVPCLCQQIDSDHAPGSNHPQENLDFPS